MDRESYLLVFGALIGLASSLLTIIIQHILSVRLENIRYNREKKDKENKLLHDSLTQGISSPSYDVTSAHVRELRKKLLGEEEPISPDHIINCDGKIRIPPTVYACFLGSTEILAENGQKCIENIEIGEKVVTVDLITNKTCLSNVIGKMINKSESFITINEVLSVSPSERVYLRQADNFTFVRAEDIRLGDVLFTDKGEKEVYSLTRTNSSVLVYNINSDNIFPFYANGYLVGGYQLSDGVVSKEPSL